MYCLMFACDPRFQALLSEKHVWYMNAGTLRLRNNNKKKAWEAEKLIIIHCKCMQRTTHFRNWCLRELQKIIWQEYFWWSPWLILKDIISFSPSIALVCHIVPQHFLLYRQPRTWCSWCCCQWKAPCSVAGSSPCQLLVVCLSNANRGFQPEYWISTGLEGQQLGSIF